MPLPAVLGAARLGMAGHKAYKLYRKAKLIKRAKAYRRAKKIGKGLLVADMASEIGTGLSRSSELPKRRGR